MVAQLVAGVEPHPEHRGPRLGARGPLALDGELALVDEADHVDVVLAESRQQQPRFSRTAATSFDETPAGGAGRSSKVTATERSAAAAPPARKAARPKARTNRAFTSLIQQA